MLSLRFDPTSKCRPIPVGIPSNFMHAACFFIKCTALHTAKNPKTEIDPRTPQQPAAGPGRTRLEAKKSLHQSLRLDPFPLPPTITTLLLFPPCALLLLADAAADDLPSPPANLTTRLLFSTPFS